MVRLMAAIIVFAAAAPSLAVWGEKLDRGIELYHAKKYSEAEAVLREAVNEEPDNPQARQMLGMTLLELEKFQEALPEFQKALELSPADKVQIGLARAYLGLKDWDRTGAALDAARGLNADNPEVYYYGGILEIARKNYAAAEQELSRAIALDPERAYAHYHIGIAYYNLKRPDKMVQHFQTFLKLAPDAPEAKKVQSLLRSVR